MKEFVAGEDIKEGEPVCWGKGKDEKLYVLRKICPKCFKKNPLHVKRCNHCGTSWAERLFC